LRKRLRSDRAGLSECAAAELLREERSARNRRGAASAQKARFHDPFTCDAHGKLKDVAANGIADFHSRVRAGKFAGVARLLKVIENGVAEHHQEYSNAVLFFRRQIFFIDRGNDYVIGVDHFGEMEFADFGKQLVGVELGQAVIGMNPVH
jgi:hypothetical protein